MKLITKISLGIFVLVLIAAAGGIIYLQQLKPQYSGELTLPGLHQPVEIIFDHYAVPHIYAQNEEDAYFALGYVHAQERLFQMEILRRIAAGRLAEILGQELVETDRFFRTIGIHQSAAQSAQAFFSENIQPYQKAGRAYLAGVNRFVEDGKTPIEFTILKIPKEKFTPRDFYLVAGFMALGFSQGFRTDPLVSKIHRKFGWPHLKDLMLGWPEGALKIPIHRSNYPDTADGLLTAIIPEISRLPAAAWAGSNAWVLSGKKSETGSVLLANDTHILFTQPSVWYEAHFEYPGFSFYGFHAAGIPFGLIGCNRSIAWGLTMFHNDDVDFYRERAHPQNADQVWVNDHWENLKVRTETIKVRNAEDVTFKVRLSRHGPIMNSVDDTVATTTPHPVSVWWTLNQFPSTTMQAAYQFAHARGIDDMRRAASLVDAPGVNIMYGDKDGNIAWWAAARLVKRPAHVNSKLFLDGASGNDEPLGYYDFNENPRSENPPAQYVYSANNQPAEVSGRLYPGYYEPDDRARRIVDHLESDTLWTVAKTQKMSINDVSTVSPNNAGEIVRTISSQPAAAQTNIQKNALELLSQWNGSHQLDDTAPTIYYKLLAYILKYTFGDELSADDFGVLLSTNMIKKTVPSLLKNNDSLWWDNIHTKDITETRKMIFRQAFERTIEDLIAQFGPNISDWQWEKVHTIEHIHLLGRRKPLDKIFNVGPFPVKGGNEVLANLAFILNTDGHFPVLYGPVMRFIVDFSDRSSMSGVNPTGQSGFFLSDHYDDQARLFNAGKFRRLMVSQNKIHQNQRGRLILKPE